jgi:hypothetical protein
MVSNLKLRTAYVYFPTLDLKQTEREAGLFFFVTHFTPGIKQKAFPRFFAEYNIA